ncbi:DoxX family protein [Streptomyces sp. NPDC047315]|uniref:DoxX family protein n=1 Tax=Streptomyces sp. NPDC047315 TaxID=3155142 RepID=UPI0033C49C99
MKVPTVRALLRTLSSSSPSNRAARRTGPRVGKALDSPQWSAVTQVASRFGVVYSGLYCLTTPQILLSVIGGGLGHRQKAADAWAKVWAIRPVRQWVAARVFDTTVGDHFDGGDNRYAWVGQFCWLTAAAAATGLWSALDRHRPRTGDVTSDARFRLLVRMCLAGQMFHYGAAKVVPLQFQLPLAKLVEPFGNFSPMTALWSQTGASKPYQVLLGCAEIAGGLLLLLPRTTTPGALLCALELTQVFILNMTYDVPVKLHSLHLLLLSLVLLAPETARLVEFSLSRREVRPAVSSELFRTRRANRIAAAAQVAAGLWMLGAQLRNDRRFWTAFGPGRAKPELYGIWNVDAYECDGRDRPALTTDGRRWRRLVVESVDVVTVQHMDDSFDLHAATIDMAGRSITLLKMTDPQWKATLALVRVGDDRLTLEGDVDGHHVRLRLSRLDLDSLPLVGRGFNWVQESSSLR